MDEITQYWFILRRQWLPASLVFVAVLAITYVTKPKITPIYEAKGQIVLKKSNSTAAILEVGKDISSLNGGSETNTQVELIRSIPVAREAIAELKIAAKPDAFLKRLTVGNIKGTDILEVSYVDTDPRQAARVINKVMDIYIKNDISTQRSEVKTAREFVEKQLPKMEIAVLQAEENLRSFKEQNQLVNPGEEASAAQGVISNTYKEINAAQAKLAAATARNAQLRQMFGADLNSAIQSGIVSESPGLQKALAELREIQQRLVIERTRFQDDHPQIADLKTKEAALKSLVQDLTVQSLVGGGQVSGKIVDLASSGIQQSFLQEFMQTEAERRSLENEIYALAQIEATYRQRINSLPKLEQQYRELERKVKAAQSTYELLLSKYQEIRLTENQTLAKAQIYTPAVVPDAPIPSSDKHMAIGAVAGLLLAVATAWALESADKTIKDPEQAKSLLGYTLLGVIPAFEDTGNVKLHYGNDKRTVPEVIVRNTPGSPVSEAFRMLQTNLRFMSLDNQLKVIVISSSIPKEGKSTTAANLAVAVSQLGRKVLIVDADMRKPSQHHIWQIKNEVGLSNILTGQNEFEEARQEVLENLDIVPAGVTPPNPVMLLDSSQMAVLVGQWSQNYDFVIIDSPPLTVAADTSILCKMANGILFVVRPGVATSGSVSLCKELLEQSAQNVLGIVVNGISRQGNSNYYSYYYYRSYYGNNKDSEGGDAQAKSKSLRGRAS